MTFICPSLEMLPLEGARGMMEVGQTNSSFPDPEPFPEEPDEHEPDEDMSLPCCTVGQV